VENLKKSEETSQKKSLGKPARGKGEHLAKCEPQAIRAVELGNKNKFHEKLEASSFVFQTRELPNYLRDVN
jgi:hypothetical protein